MEYTPKEIKRMELLQSNRGLSPQALWRKMWVRIFVGPVGLFLAFFIILVAILWIHDPQDRLNYFFIGFAVANILALHTLISVVLQMWPLNEKVLDWEKIEKALQEAKASKEP